MRSISILLLSAAAFPAFAVDATGSEPPVSFDIEFRYHVQDNLAEQDVFIEREAGSGEVWRPRPEDRDLDAPLYASAVPQAHAPFDTSDIGPFPMGQPLNLTLGEWYGATGVGQYRCENGQGHLEVAFEGLVPDGVYTIWHFFASAAPTDPFIGTFDLPVGTMDGEQSIFVADGQGNAVYDQTYASCLQLSGEQLAAGLALNWHSDGLTYGVKPGDFALNAHIQLYAGLPARPGL